MQPEQFSECKIVANHLVGSNTPPLFFPVSNSFSFFTHFSNTFYMKHKSNPILNITFSFALKVIRYSEQLETERRYILARQILKSGTSIGANVRESQHAESRNGFIHKLKIAAKEAEETRYWLELCRSSENYPPPVSLLPELDQIQKLLSSIIHTSKQNRGKKDHTNHAPSDQSSS
jgi:four helix bundle protein